MDDEIRRLERESPNDPALVGRLIRAAVRAGGIPYALDRLTREPDSAIWREVYIGCGGVHAQLINDNMLGESLRITLPDYQGRREDLIVGLNNLEDGPQDIETMLTRYTAVAHGGTRQDGVIVMPLRLEVAIAKAMDSIRSTPMFSREFHAYLDSFAISIEQSQPVYGKITDGDTITRATLDELTLEGKRVQHQINIPSSSFFVIIASEEGESREPLYASTGPLAAEYSDLSPPMITALEKSLEQLTDDKNPGPLLQSMSTLMDGRRRLVSYVTASGNQIAQGNTRALGLGCIDYQDQTRVFYVDACDVGNGQARYTRGCRRAKVD